MKKNIIKLIEIYNKLNLNETNRPIYIKIRKDFENKSNYWLLLYLINYLDINHNNIKIQIIMTYKRLFETDNTDIYLIKII